MTADIDGKPLLVGVQTTVQMDRKPVNVINSVYGLDNPSAWLKNQIQSGHDFTLLDEKRANTFLQTYGAYSTTVGGDACSTGDSVTQNGEKSNTEFLRSGRVVR